MIKQKIFESCVPLVRLLTAAALPTGGALKNRGNRPVTSL